jgi:hypothetical protein
MDRPVIKFGDVKVGDVIKYSFAFDNEEPPTIGISLAEIMAVTPKHCTLEYTDFAGKNVKIPYESIVAVYRKIN